ncbi:phosphatase PAP2 family protein [Chryseobacterium sp. JUb7]|uniref:phosphatase PAP2 family protein n=1 Tax=Chryseobacterium sp. JUb7 TaxID=2940599 RepID=UPI0021677837|nr:phosphatase PAP2 family protein [Chryseobacterium sp. JUb7]MCS3531259.1 undecaprenyl-diphosphatase [Chryseobacterium sp. JUb7]
MESLFDSLKKSDTALFLFINGKHSAFFDIIMYWASDKLFWIPFYAVLLFFMIKIYKKFSVYILLAIGITITLSDQIASGLIKKTVMRLRPSHEPSLIPLIHLSKAGPGGMYGFVSSHSANAFGLLIFLFLVLPSTYKWLKFVLLFWAILVSYSRIYNGVHYPSDVIGGAIVGILSGITIWTIFKIIFKGNTSLNK